MALTDGQADTLIAAYEAIRADLATAYPTPTRKIKSAINALVLAKALLTRYKTIN